MSYINRLVYKKRVLYLVIIDHFHLYSIIASLVQLTGELAGAFTTTPCSLATLKQCRCSNTLKARLTRLITNHVPIGEYRLRFFSNEPCSCPCKKAEIKMRQYLLFNCKRFKKAWNPKR